MLNFQDLKKLVLICLLIISISGKSQNNPVQLKKSKTQTALVQNLTNSLKHDTCLDKKFSVVFYLIDDSAYTFSSAMPPATLLLLDSLIFKMNQVFSRICVSFENCKTVVIPNYPYNRWKKNVVDTVVTSNWYTHHTINIYLPSEVLEGQTLHPKHPFGYTYGVAPNPLLSKDVIVIQQNEAFNFNYAMVNNQLPVYRGSKLMHLLGHYFGLPHTYDEINSSSPTSPPPPAGVISKEFVDRSNCYTHGDGFCDTEADPTPMISYGPAPFCYNTQMIKDGKGQFYLAPTDNFMSGTDCACRFSQEQYNFMARFIVAKRLYLH